jgi:hypothetical protein
MPCQEPPESTKQDYTLRKILQVPKIPLTSNAAHQVRLEADARHERTLYAVTCMRLFK